MEAIPHVNSSLSIEMQSREMQSRGMHVDKEELVRSLEGLEREAEDASGEVQLC